MINAHWKRAAAWLVLALLVAVAARWHAGRSGDAPEVPFAGPASAAPPVFADRTSDYRITVSHRQGDVRLTGLDETLGPGVCTLDFDNDGWLDLYLVNGSGDSRFFGRGHWWQNAAGHRLLRNVEGRYFIDVTAKAGVSARTQGQGCVAADLDNDGDTDLFVTNIGANLLYRNNGDGSFTDVTAQAGLQSDGWHTAAAVADVDGDGLLDLYVGGFIDYEKGSRTYETGSQFRQDMPPFFNSALFPPLPNTLYRNLGKLEFQDMTETAGVADNDGRTLAAVWLDINDDSRPDLIVLNASGTGSTSAYVNRGDWHFAAVGIASRIESGLALRGIAVGDLDHDDRPDLVLTGSSGERTLLLQREASTPHDAPRFVDVARPWQVANERYAAMSPWAPVIADFNNDGWSDLLIANGQLVPDPDAPHVTIGQAKQLWLNSGQALLRAIEPAPRSPLRDHQSARGMVVADFDNDGQLDVFIAHNNDLGQLLINARRSEGHWIGMRLTDSHGNRDGVGARVAVTTRLGTQWRWSTKGSGFLSDGDTRLHVGLGAARKVTIRVIWPDGGTSVWRDMEADRYLQLTRGSDAAHTISHRLPPPTAPGDAVSAAEPAVRAEYYRSLVEAPVTDEFPPALSAVLEDPDAQVRAAVLTALAARRSAPGLRLVIDFLDDPDGNVATQAVATLCAYEDEDTVRYLLRMFAHPAATARARTAACFAGYFHGFQASRAVIHRKYLALPYLIDLLDDADRQVRLVAVRALGLSERYRSAGALTELLAAPDPALRIAAVDALGLIRDTSALPALLGRLRDTHDSPRLAARVLIALKRLNYDQLDATADDFAAGRGVYANIPLVTRLRSLDAVLRARDGVVFPRERLLALADAAFQRGTHTEEADYRYARLMAGADDGRPRPDLQALLAHPAPRVRAAAYAALFATSRPLRARLVRAALADPAEVVRRAMLEQVTRERFPVHDSALAAALGNVDTRLAALRALRGMPSPALAQSLRAWIGDPESPDDIRAASLGVLCNSGIRPDLPGVKPAQAGTHLQLALLTCETAQLPPLVVATVPPAFLGPYLHAGSDAVATAAVDFLLTRQELWARRAVLDILHEDDRAALRAHVLASLPDGYLDTGGPLLDIASNRADPLRLVALRRLQGTGDPRAIERLEALVRDDTDDINARILADLALPPTARTFARAGP